MYQNPHARFTTDTSHSYLHTLKRSLVNLQRRSTKSTAAYRSFYPHKSDHRCNTAERPFYTSFIPSPYLHPWLTRVLKTHAPWTTNASRSLGPPHPAQRPWRRKGAETGRSAQISGPKTPRGTALCHLHHTKPRTPQTRQHSLLRAACACAHLAPLTAHGLGQNHTYFVRHGLDDIHFRRPPRLDLLET